MENNREKKGPLRKFRGLVSNLVDRRTLQPGDHIYSWRGLLYAHHGIYAGNEEVIHFGKVDVEGQSSKFGMFGSIVTSNKTDRYECNICYGHQRQDGVTKSCLDCFLDKGKLYRYKYRVSTRFYVFKMRGGTCTRAISDPSNIVLCRANYLLTHNGFGEYNLLKHNCEDFALYCKTGKLVPTLGGSGQAIFNVIGFGANVFAPLIMSFTCCMTDIEKNRSTYCIPVEDLTRIYRTSEDEEDFYDMLKPFRV